MKYFIFIVLISTISAIQMQGDWIDPHDMNTNVKQKYNLKKSSSTSSLDINSNIDPMPSIYLTHLKRVVSVLINSAHVDKRDLDWYHGHVRFNIDPKDYEFLVNFAKTDPTLDTLRKLDTVFSNSFKRTFIDEYLHRVESFQLRLYSIVMNIQNLWLIGAFFLLYCVYQLFKNNFSAMYIFKYLIIILLIVDFGSRYHQLLEEAEEHNLGIVYSNQCETSKMSWGQYTKFLLSGKDCGKMTVTPLDAFLFQIKNLIIIPMHAFGTGMGGFGKNMFTTLPWGLNIILWPVLLVFTLILLLFLLTICTGQPIEFNVFHLVKLKFGGGTQKENTLTMPAVERLMDKVLHRPLIQNVHVGLEPSINKKNNTKERNGDTKKETIFLSDPETQHNAVPEVQSQSVKTEPEEQIKVAQESDDSFLQKINNILNSTDLNYSSREEATSLSSKDILDESKSKNVKELE